MKVPLAFVLLTMCVPVYSQTWTRTDTAMEVAFVGTVLMDYSQTRHFLAKGEFVEGNPLLGEQPSRGLLIVGCSASVLAHAAISYVLPPKWRRAWQVVSVVVETGNNIRTAKMVGGLKFSW